MKKGIKLTLLLACMLMIFVFSSQNAADSKGTSDGLLFQIVSIFVSDPKQIEFLMVSFGTIIRKFAHFSEFLVLGVLLYLNVCEYFIGHRIPLSFTCGVLYAFSDEIHQIFVDGRVFAIKDILIDSCGVMSGIVIAFLAGNLLLKIAKGHSAI